MNHSYNKCEIKTKTCYNVKCFDIRSLFIIIILIFASVNYADTDGALILQHADNNENFYDNVQGEFISHLRGNVVFLYEDVRMSADSAVWQRSTGIINFAGNIAVEQRGQLMTCEVLQFTRDQNMLSATGNVLYQDSARITFIRGDSADYLTNESEALLYGNPLLTRIDNENADTIFLRGRLISYNDSTKTAIATDSVRIEMGSLLATGQSATYFANDKKAILRIDPVIYYDGHRIVGDSVDLFIGDERLESAAVIGNTHGFYMEIAEVSDTANLQDTTNLSDTNNLTNANAFVIPDTTITNIWSDSLHMTMTEGGKVEIIQAFGDVRGDFREIVPARNRTTHANFTSDSLRMFMFDAGKIREINVLSGARGIYAERNDSTGATITTNLSSDSLRIMMFENGKIRAMHAHGSAHGRSAEWSASVSDSLITHIWGDSLRLTIADAGRVRSIRAFGREAEHVRSINFELADSTRANVVSGLRMTLVFDSAGKVERAAVVGSASSLYHLTEDDGGGRNVANGDRIFVMFQNGKARRLRVVGNVNGFYAP